MTDAQTVTARLPQKLVIELEEASAAEQLGKSEVMRRILVEGLQHWHIQRALSLFKEGMISFGQAARMAKVSVWKFSDLLMENKVPLQLDRRELEREFQSAGWL